MHKEMNTSHLDRILVVDDTTANLQLLTNLLTAHGYTVHPASDGELALEFVRSTQPDLILLDIRMPGIDGFEVCHRLKADERTRAIPVIFISILEDERDKVKGFQAGAVDYITKPFQAEEVLARVRIQLHLRELTEHLEQKVAERTEALHAANAQLQRELAERKQAEAALRQSETLLNATQRLAKIGGWDWDVEQQTSFWTEETYRIHGFEPRAFAPGSSEYIDRSLACYDPADRPIISAAFQRCVQQGEGYDLEFPFTSADGHRKWVRTTATAVREAGRVVKVVGNIMDITGRKQAEEKLKASEERLRLTLEAAQIGIWDWDVTNDRYYASPIYYSMLGYAPKEGPADRNEWVQRLHPDDTNTVLEQINKILSRTCDAYAYEARFRHADGSYRWMCAIGYGTEYDPNGKLTRMLGLRMDIDARKRMEDELSAYRGQLEALVRDRTAQLETANKELDAFAYTVSHDLRAPLRHIDGFIELLQKKAGAVLDEQSRHYMGAISGSAQKMGLLIDDLLSFSRMGRDAMTFQQVALGPLVHDVIQELESDAAGREIVWRIGELPAVDGDAAMLRMVMTNMIANALKFTRPRPQAWIEVGSLPGQGFETVIFVRDNGVGFDMTYVDKLFGVFQRLHRADEFEGTGIGLANVRRIVARHGGRTWAEGKVDHGAAFYFALPRTLQGGEDEKP
jgi:PAS domain S-box-containing protein